MKRGLINLLSGALFGAGLVLSEMVNPARVLGFLDLFGAWDPTLAFVMGGALIPAALAYALSRKLPRPWAESRFQLPIRREIDRPLVVGALMFGLGWGLIGFCPGPALAALVSGRWQAWLFVAAMLAGMALYRLWQERGAVADD